MLTLGMHKCEYTIYRVSQIITIFDVIQHIYVVIHIVQMHVDIYIYISYSYTRSYPMISTHIFIYNNR